MKRLLFDTNILLDVLLDRQPHAEASSLAWTAIEQGTAEGAVAAHALTTIHYFLHKELGNAKAKNIITKILQVFELAAINRDVIDEAIKYPCSDFEDAVTAAAARAAGCDYIVTRDAKGFRGTPLRCLTPGATIPLFRKS